MMSYEMFREIVKEKFKDYLPDEYSQGEVVVSKLKKVNCQKDAITICLHNGRGISPNLYINNMYEEYKRSGNLEQVFYNAAREYVYADNDIDEKDVTVSFDNFEENVVMCLVNTEINKELLEDIPSRAFQDLSVIYRVVVSKELFAVGTTIVTNDLMHDLGVTEEDLFRLASENTRRIYPVEVLPLQTIILNSKLAQGLPREIISELSEVGEPKETLWVISNECNINGAVNMLYENVLHELAEKVGTDLYILPSSRHEVMAASVEMGSLENFSQMVQDANMEVIELSERLSNNVYHYDKDLRKLTMATDVPNKCLDGFTCEPPMVYDTEMKR